MKSSLPKVLHEIGDRPIIDHVLESAIEIDHNSSPIVVLRHHKDVIESHLKTSFPNAVTVEQSDNPGTAAAVQSTLEEIQRYAQENASFEESGVVLVLSGDTPLITPQLLSDFISFHRQEKNSLSVLSSRIDNPYGYGRIIRGKDGFVSKIVEEKDATKFEKSINEINSGIYIFDFTVLKDNIFKISNNNAQNEYYLTDMIGITVEQNKRVGAFEISDSTQIEGINDRVQLANLNRILNSKVIESHQRNGVTFIDPMNTYVSDTVEIERDVIIEPGCYISGNTKIASGAKIMLGSRIISGQIGQNSSIGPYAFIRPGTQTSKSSKIGAFVEAKNAQIGNNSKVPHLTYIGDAEIGTDSNVGAGSIFANYDGVNKHRTTIGNHVFLGSNSTLVAPCQIGDDAKIPAGTVLIKDTVETGIMPVVKKSKIDKTYKMWDKRLLKSRNNKSRKVYKKLPSPLKKVYRTIRTKLLKSPLNKNCNDEK